MNKMRSLKAFNEWIDGRPRNEPLSQTEIDGLRSCIESLEGRLEAAHSYMKAMNDLKSRMGAHSLKILSILRKTGQL
jgi:hypothetical protein